MRYKSLLKWISIAELMIIILIRVLYWYLCFNFHNSYALIEDTQWTFNRIVVDGDAAGKVYFEGCMPVFVAANQSFMFITEHNDLYKGTIKLYHAKEYTNAYMLTPSDEKNGFLAYIIPSSSNVLHRHSDSLSIMFYYKPYGMTPMRLEYIFIPADSSSYI